MENNNNVVNGSDETKYKEYKTDSTCRNLPRGACDRLGIMELFNDAAINETFTRHFQSLMDMHNMDTRTVAETIGVTPRTVQRYLDFSYDLNMASMKLRSFIGLAALFGDDFLGGAIDWAKLEKFLTSK